MLFTFPSRYWYTIGLRRVFSLGGWARRIHTGFHVPRATRDPARLRLGSDTGLSPSAVPLSRGFSSPRSCHLAVPQPHGGRNHRGLGFAPFARRYWGYHVCFLFLRVLRCFSSPGSLHRLSGDDGASLRRVAPFGHPRVTGRLHLTAAFRSLPRTGIRRAPFFAFLPPCLFASPKGRTAEA